MNPKKSSKIIPLTISLGVTSVTFLGTTIYFAYKYYNCKHTNENYQNEASNDENNRELTIPYVGTMNGEILGPARRLHENDHEDSPYYKRFDFYNAVSNDHLTIISHFKTYQQTCEYSCGPACALMVMNYFGENLKEEITEQLLAKELDTIPDFGTTTKNLEKCFRKRNYHIESSVGIPDGKFDPKKGFLQFKEYLLDKLKKGIPMIVESVEWGGHWFVIIGYDTMGTENTDDDVLIIADPYDTTDHYQDGYIILSAERFFSSWFDGRLFAKGENIQQFIVAWK
ncbi:uncharacterized protein TRFO_30847 [Tritrichomonas foetus]|uniref:Peptidase C39-like domain-containing protein n=1 Tax=Tritrichomonas foetus TaxID=1144522 RepID=A0A1J4JTR4_9EUKA|nr:uncharacterized protein TRFO_30847 [Tritrichomonas foetus]|eukprot:OHT02146.1 uncharacterized protein TRFO_30847 [Tritrichomonas foetus]